MCTWMFTVALYIIAQNRKQTKCPSIKQTVIHPYHGIPLSNEKEQTTDTCNYLGFIQNLGGVPGKIWSWSPYTEGRERQKKEAATPDCWVAALISKGTYTGGFPWATARWLNLHTPTRILRACTEALTGFSHYLVQTVSATPFSLKAAFLKQLLVCKQWAECTFQGQGRGWGASNCPGPTLGSTGGHILSMTSSNTWVDRKGITLYEKSQSQKVTDYMILFI